MSEQEELEILRSTILTYKDVKSVSLQCQVEGHEKWGDIELNDWILEIFYEDGSSTLTYLYRDEWFDTSLKNLDHYINHYR